MIQRIACSLACLLLTGPISAAGILIPEDREIPPLALVSHRVRVSIDDQIAETQITQVFRNHTGRDLEATYLFPIPKDANVNKLSMKIGDREMAGEVLDSKKAAEIYNEIVRRTKDPALLEYVGSNLLRLRVFPIPPRKDVTISIRYLSLVPRDGATCEYVLPFKSTGRAVRTLEEFDISVRIQSKEPIQNIYSPTHGITVRQPKPTEADVQFEKRQAVLDRDFHLYYGVGTSDIGLTAVFHKPISGEEGYFLLLVNPALERKAEVVIPRDFVLVLDTSGSMEGIKMDQAKKAMQVVLGKLRPEDRFGMMNFASTYRRYRDTLVPADRERIEDAAKWVEALQATGGTAIDAALAAALQMRGEDASRPFTIVFFTDGLPTVGEVNTDRILENVKAKNSANTRIFSFGVGDDVNASFLDQLAEITRSVSTYVRPAEDIAEKTAGLLAKISQPALTNLKLAVGDSIRLNEMYPVQLPDLFHGNQLVLLGKYAGHGSTALTLSGAVGRDKRSYTYPVNFPEKTAGDRDFVEQLWARRKVGYLLDQIRLNGQHKEIMDELLSLAKRYGIATPFTSYLVVPDLAQPLTQGRGSRSPVPVDQPAAGLQLEADSIREKAENGASGGGRPFGGGGFGGGGFGGGRGGFGGRDGSDLKPAAAPQSVDDYARKLAKNNGTGESRGVIEIDRLEKDLKANAAEAKNGDKEAANLEAKYRALGERQQAFDAAKLAFNGSGFRQSQSGQVGVNLSLYSNQLRDQSQVAPTANRIVNGRNCLEVGGVWIDQGFNDTMKALVVKAQSEAYFAILAKAPEMKEAFSLGNYLVYVTPSKTALVIDAANGREKLTEAEIAALFAK